MKLRVLYSNEPYKKTYNLFYGLPPFRVPYKFLYADGVGAGNYEFLYDSREELYNQDLKTQLVFFGREIDRTKLLNTFSFIEREMFRYRRNFLEKGTQKEIKANAFSVLERSLKEISFMGKALLDSQPREILKGDLKGIESSPREIEKEFSRILESIEKNLDTLRGNFLLESIEKKVANHKIKDLSREYTFESNLVENKTLEKYTSKSIKIQSQKTIDFNTSRGVETSYKIDLTGEREKRFQTLLNGISLQRKVEKDLDVLESLFEKSYTIFRKKDILTDKQKELEKEAKPKDFFALKLEIMTTRNHLKEITIEKLISEFLREISKEVQNDDLKNIVRRKVYETKRAKEVSKLERLKVKDMKIQGLVLALERKKEKDTQIDILIRDFVKGSKDLFIESLEAELTRTIVKDVLNEVLERKLDRNINREIKTLDPSKFLERQKVIEVFREMFGKYFDKETLKPLENIEIRQFGDKKPVEKNLLLSSIVARVEKEALRSILSESNISRLEKGVLRAVEVFEIEMFEKMEKSEVEVLFSKVLEQKEKKQISVLEIEKDLKLYKRLWFMKEMKPYDLLILPQDYPYNTEPVEFSTEEMTPENEGVVYPNTFYKRIDVHPIPWGEDFEPEEIPVAINILVEMVNIFMLLWAKFHKPFWGWTGTQAVLGITESVYEWLMLETSQEEMNRLGVKRHYERAFKWLRWEAEKMALKARNDMELRGNYYVGLLLEELIYYLKDHHVDIMPIFEDIQKMDEWRHIYKGRTLENDVKFILDKTKGLRHKLAIGKEIQENG